jgi:hypothetical protein
MKYSGNVYFIESDDTDEYWMAQKWQIAYINSEIEYINNYSFGMGGCYPSTNNAEKKITNNTYEYMFRYNSKCHSYELENVNTGKIRKVKVLKLNS